MPEAYVIGVDIGTTGTKAVLVGEDSRVVAQSAAVEHPTAFPPNVPGAVEQDPDDWWAGTTSCVREVLEKAQVPPDAVEAVGVSSQAPCAVLVDAEGRPTHPALLWMDRRSDKQCRDRAGAHRQIQDIAANAPDPYYAAPKVAWLLENVPGLRQRTTHLLMANGYVNMKLTGKRSIDTGHAGLCLLAGIEDVQWSPELAELWGVPREWLPPIGRPTEVLGRVSPEAAAVTGLRPGTLVVHGGVDAATASLEAGVAAEGDICEMTGQSTVLNAAVRYEALRQGVGALSVFAYPVPGLYLLFGSMSSTGGILRWFRDQFGDPERAEAVETGTDAFVTLDQLAGTVPAGSGGLLLLPYFLGERAPVWDSDARGILLGLSMSTTRSHVVRSILEGTAYGLNHNLEEMRKRGLRPPVLRVVGGGAKGRTWNQIKADVTGLPVEVPLETMGAPVGSALLAAVGARIVEDLAEAVRARYRAREQLRPDMARHGHYQGYYELYKQLYPALRDRNVFAQLSKLRHAVDAEER
ncbi:FGGY-family carbohydrate kinase [Geodermatophilus sp. SYSU D00742]